MDTRSIEEPLGQFVRVLSQAIRVNQVIVFGSYLEGTATAESDVDVIVVTDDFEHLMEDERLDILEAAAEGIEPSIHAWGFTNHELEEASALTTLGYARQAGIRFDPLAV